VSRDLSLFNCNTDDYESTNSASRLGMKVGIVEKGNQHWLVEFTYKKTHFFIIKKLLSLQINHILIII